MEKVCSHVIMIKLCYRDMSVRFSEMLTVHWQQCVGSCATIDGHFVGLFSFLLLVHLQRLHALYLQALEKTESSGKYS